MADDIARPALFHETTESVNPHWLSLCNTHIFMSRAVRDGMAELDCGTCGETSALEVVIPESISLNLTITGEAHQVLEDAMNGLDDSGLLVNILSGGCSGYKYDLQIIDPPDEELYISFEVDGIKVFVPKAASGLLDGIEIGYEDRLMGGGFKVENPNAERSCGCGESFG